MRFLKGSSGSRRLQPVATLHGDMERLRARLLSENDLFKSLTPGDMGDLANRLAMVTCPRGRLVYAPGETGEALFILKTGHVRLYRLAADGRKLVFATLEPGTVFGEMGVIGQSMTGTFAEAVEDCTVCIMSQVDVERVMIDHPGVALTMIRLLSKRLQTAEDMLEQLAFTPVASRVARLLLTLVVGDEVAGYSHQELADMLATSRETVSRALVDLKMAGVIAIDRRCIRLLDREALVSAAETDA